MPKSPKRKRFGSRLLAWWPVRVFVEVWLRLAAFGATVFGPRWAYFWARVVAWLAWVFLRRLRFTALRNVDLCFPERPQAERTRIARASLRHFCYLFADYMLAPRCFAGGRGVNFMDGCTREDPYIQWVGQGQAAFILAAHFGNWEVGTYNVNRFGFAPLMVIAKPVAPPALGRLMTRARKIYGNEVHEHRGGARAYARALRENRVVGVLVDQNGGDFAPVEAFFGIPCTWQADFARLAVRGGGRIGHAAMVRDGERAFFRYLPTRTLAYEATTPPMKIVADYRDSLESFIRQYPEQYLWAHRRFKARKPGWPDAYADLGTRWGVAERDALVAGRTGGA
ncbi:MAG: hypothetical protein HS108_10935 [Planctomycetes bacterium]|nr:hypothetical protein [Planctomycetota bacterium]